MALDLFFQKIHRSIENPFTPFQFFPASLAPAIVPGLRQCAKMVFPQRRVHIPAKGTYTSGWGHCLRYALERWSASSSKAARKFRMGKFLERSMRLLRVRRATNATKLRWRVRIASWAPEVLDRWLQQC